MARGFAARPPVRDTEARNALVVKWLYLVDWYVKRVKRGSLSFEEAVAAGHEGLIRAAELYDPERGTVFSTYAVRWIKQAVYLAREEARLIHIPAYLARPSSPPPPGSRRAKRTPELKACAAKARRLGSLPEDHSSWHPVTPELADPLLHSEESEKLARALRYLHGQQRAVIRMRFEEGLTLKAAGERLGVCRERVRQVERDALERLRELMM